jgi:hypothetical protein
MLHYLLSPRTRLYTEIFTSEAVIRGDRARLLGFDVRELALKICVVVRPCRSINARSCIAFKPKERFPHQIHADVMKKRCALLLPPLLCYLSYTCERL